VAMTVAPTAAAKVVTSVAPMELEPHTVAVVVGVIEAAAKAAAKVVTPEAGWTAAVLEGAVTEAAAKVAAARAVARAARAVRAAAESVRCSRASTRDQRDSLRRIPIAGSRPP